MVTVDGEDKIQLKGSSNYKIYMNGKPSNLLSGDNASDVLKSMPASSIKNIEVITDPGSKYDAEGVGGIINIITTKNALQGYTGTIRANASTLGSFGGGGYVSMKAGSVLLLIMAITTVIPPGMIPIRCEMRKKRNTSRVTRLLPVRLLC